MEVLKHGESAGVVATCGQEHACRCATEVIAMNAQTPARLNGAPHLDVATLPTFSALPTRHGSTTADGTVCFALRSAHWHLGTPTMRCASFSVHQHGTDCSVEQMKWAVRQHMLVSG
jgi:hypothetical protein